MFHTAMPHYFVTSSKSIKGKSDILSDVLNLKFLTYDEKNNHQELADSIEQLVGLVEDKRNVIAENQRW